MIERVLLMLALVAALAVAPAQANRVVNLVESDGAIDVDVLSSSAVTGSSASIAVDLSAATEGRLLIALITIRSIDTVATPAAGWTLVCQQDDGASSALPHSLCYTLTAGPAEGTHTWTLGAAGYYSVIVLETDASSVSDFAVSANGTLGVVTIPTGGSALGYVGQARSVTAADNVPPAGYTQLVDTYAVDPRASGCAALATPAVGDTNGTDAFTASTGDLNTLHLALAP